MEFTRRLEHPSSQGLRLAPRPVPDAAAGSAHRSRLPLGLHRPLPTEADPGEPPRPHAMNFSSSASACAALSPMYPYKVVAE